MSESLRPLIAVAGADQCLDSLNGPGGMAEVIVDASASVDASISRIESYTWTVARQSLEAKGPLARFEVAPGLHVVELTVRDERGQTASDHMLVRAREEPMESLAEKPIEEELNPDTEPVLLPVPEPSTALLVGLGLAGFSVLRKRRNLST